MELRRSKLKEELWRLKRNAIFGSRKIDEKLVKEALENFLSVFEKPNPREQRDLIKLTIKEVRFSSN